MNDHREINGSANPDKRLPSGFSLCGRVLTLTVGLPASGKTTFAENAGVDFTISLDDCRETLWGDRAIQDGRGGINALLALQDALILEAMKENKSIIVHNTSILKKYRTPLLELARNKGYHTQIVYFDMPVEKCIRRNQQRRDAVPREAMEDFAAKLEVPAADEADRVVTASMLDETLVKNPCEAPP
ncbi:MAG: AAA family ATPase [Thermodesulfobacteriota bacterium]